MKDKKGNIVNIGDTLYNEKYPKSHQTTVINIVEDVITCHGGLSKKTVKIGQNSLLKTHWVKTI